MKNWACQPRACGRNGPEIKSGELLPRMRARGTPERGSCTPRFCAKIPPAEPRMGNGGAGVQKEGGDSCAWSFRELPTCLPTVDRRRVVFTRIHRNRQMQHQSERDSITPTISGGDDFTKKKKLF